jgi:hypothetical protein
MLAALAITCIPFLLLLSGALAIAIYRLVSVG